MVKLDDMPKPFERGCLLGDWLLRLKHFKCFFLDDEPVFLSEKPQVKAEVRN